MGVHDLPPRPAITTDRHHMPPAFTAMRCGGIGVVIRPGPLMTAQWLGLDAPLGDLRKVMEADIMAYSSYNR